LINENFIEPCEEALKILIKEKKGYSYYPKRDCTNCRTYLSKYDY